MNDQDEVIAALAEAIPSGDSGWYRAQCPFCPTILAKTDKRRAFSINIRSGWYNCFRCQTTGRLRESDEWVPVEDEPKKETKEVIFDPPEDFILLDGPAKSAMVYQEPLNYMKSRGISDQTIKDAGIGACLRGEYSGRIVVPIRSPYDPTWLGFSARDWTNRQELRYRYPPNMQRGTIMYEYRVLLEESSEPALIVEGVFDVLPYFGRAAACLGKPSKWQVDAMCRAKRPLAIVLDGDAWKEAWTLARKLKLDGVCVGSVRLPAGKDPNTVDRDWLLEEAAKSIE